MKLPNDSIGPTDLISYRECPRRMSYGMKRHVDQGEQDHGQMPESSVYGAVWARGYGSAIHEAISAVEEGWSDEDAIQQAWNRHGSVLLPSDVDLLRSDLETYHTRDFPGMRTIANEMEIRVPLVEIDGVQIYFRTRIDRLLERLDAPGHFTHLDYKSSKWAKSETEVHEDLQLWMMNWAIHEFWPECVRLAQIYDQLRYGQIPTSKSADQRRQVREFIVKQVTTILRDEGVREDGLLKPQHNQWCPWCPIMESCSVVEDLTDFAQGRIAALAPAYKDGRRTKLDIDLSDLAPYVEKLEAVNKALKVLERFSDTLKGILRQMPEEERLALGWKIRERKDSVFTSPAKEALHAELGERFYDLVKVTKSSLESELADEPELKEWALSLAEERVGSAAVVPA